MPTPPPLPPAKPSRTKTLLVSLLALASLAAAGITIWRTMSSFEPEEDVPAEEAAGAEAPIPIPLREIDVDRLVGQHLDKQDYFRGIEAATLAEYDRANAPDKPWHAEGRQAARLFAVFAVWNDFYGQGILQTCDAFAAAAYKKGCRDPLIASICDIRIFNGRHSNDNAGAQDHIRRTRKLNASNYPPLFKLIATRTLLRNLIYTKNYPEDLRDDLSPSWAEIPSFVPEVGAQFSAFLKENPPTELLFFRTRQLFDDVEDGECLVPIEHEIESAFSRENPTHPVRAALRGVFLTAWAWQARGGGWANTVTQEGWRLMADRLEQANRVLTDACEKNPDDYLAATVMLSVELGQGTGRSTMEEWFRRAMNGHPDNYAACSSKLRYLQPRWYGSPQDVVKFGQQCVETDNWRANLPLILPNGISDLANYQEDLYLNDVVWNLVSPVYEEYLKRYPDSIGVRTEYANCAALGNRLDVLRKQLDALGDNWDRSVWSDRNYRRISALVK